MKKRKQRIQLAYMRLLVAILRAGAVVLLATASASAQPANVAVKRDHVWGAFMSMVLYVDGQPVARLANGESKALSLPPGEHVLAVRKSPFESSVSEATIEPKTGKHYSFRITYRAGDGFNLQRSWN